MERGTTRHVRVFCSTINDGVATLSAEESHHVSRVLRLKAGDEAIVFDGAGHEWTGSIAESSDRQVRIALGAPRIAIPEPAIAMVLAVGLLKSDAMADVVRDATMLGVSAVVPFVAAHTALPGAAVRSRLSDRWTRVAIASAKQCGRAVVPRITDVVSFDTALETAVDARLICVEPRAGLTAGSMQADAPSSALVLVGPEGGWSPAEIDRATAAGARPLSLGPRTLRAESAPAIALAALWTRWGWQ